MESVIHSCNYVVAIVTVTMFRPQVQDGRVCVQLPITDANILNKPSRTADIW
jgi:hypothetical protein